MKKKNILPILSALIIVVGFYITTYSWSGWNNLITTDGEVLTAAKWNEMISFLSGATNTTSSWSNSGSSIYYNGGNVGIGTTSPSSLLHVQGNIADYAAYIYQYGGATGAYGGLKVRTESTGVSSFLVNNAGNNLFEVRGSGNIYMAGNVGIGTMSPDTKLTILAPTATLNAVNPIITSISPLIGASSVGMYNSVDSVTPAGLGILFRTYKANIGLIEAVKIDNDGNVGIGTTSPGGKLSIIGSTNTSSTYGLNVANSGGTSNLFVRDDGAIGIGTTSPADKLEIYDGSQTIYTNSMWGQYLRDKTATAKNLRMGFIPSWNAGAIQAQEDGVGYLPLALQNQGGNVGIGTTDPKSKLHVVGLPEYADNTAATSAGLTVGAFYRTGDILKVVH